MGSGTNPDPFPLRPSFGSEANAIRREGRSRRRAFGGPWPRIPTRTLSSEAGIDLREEGFSPTEWPQVAGWTRFPFFGPRGFRPRLFLSLRPHLKTTPLPGNRDFWT